AYNKYNTDIDEDSMTSEDKQTKKNISSLNKDITSAFDKIETGYQEKDKKKIEKGQQKLSTIQTDAN
ncbi:hypothetical protein BU077_09910, partial [Staphylococcus warneri]